MNSVKLSQIKKGISSARIDLNLDRLTVENTEKIIYFLNNLFHTSLHLSLMLFLKFNPLAFIN